jgi:hypothetical protein
VVGATCLFTPYAAFSQPEHTTHCCQYHPIVFLIEHQCHNSTSLFEAVINWSRAEIQ